jgi:hypothetical protein
MAGLLPIDQRTVRATYDRHRAAPGARPGKAGTVRQAR